MKINNIDLLLGQVVTQIEKTGDEELIFYLLNGDKIRMHHSQDCCEHVYIESIEGDLDDLIGIPLLKAEEVSNSEYEENWLKTQEYVDSYTWTFYKFATIKGYVDIRWLGESNGYYSESVDIEKIN